MREDCKWKKLSNNILSLSQEAAAAKSADSSVINATIGMLNDTDNSFYTFKAVSEVLKEVSSYEAFSYADTDGGEEFREAILKWVFDDCIKAFNQYHVGVVSTPGGSGAISTTFSNYFWVIPGACKL